MYLVPPANKLGNRARVVATLLLLAGCPGCRRPAPSAAPASPVASASPRAAPSALPEFEIKAVSRQEGEATWYDVPDRSLAQRRAWPAEMTAASDTLPPNTYVRVRRVENGQSVIVRITDHGIHQKGTVIDLDRTAAEALGMVKAGKAQVQLEVLALKNADATGPPTHSTGEATPPPKQPGASAADEKAAAARKP